MALNITLDKTDLTFNPKTAGYTFFQVHIEQNKLQ